LPEWHSMKPEKVVPATLTEAEKGYSDMARAYLTAFDQLEIVTLTQDGTTEMAFLYDKPLPGYEAPDGKLTSLPANIFMPNPNDPEDQKFQTAPFTFEMENDRGEKIGRSFTINQLTPQGKKDMIDLASGLQARIDDKTTSDTDRKKYQQFMGSLKATADAQVEWYKKGDKKNDSWKEVKAILDDPNQLRKYAKGELKLKLSKEQEVVQAMPPAAKELRAAFEAEIKALGAMKGAELTAELTKRRTALGTKADGTAMGADEIKAAGAAVLPEEQRKPGSAKSPITPETLMAKAALAWPEKMPAQREDDLRRQLPEVMKLRPKFKLDAAIAKADENRSPKTKELLAFLDEAKVYSEGEGAAKKSFMFDDLSPPGYTSRKSGQKIDLPDLEVATLFETKQMEYPTTSGGIFRVQELTQKGKQDMADLAASLQLRIDAKDIPDTEKQKYRDMLGDIQELAKNREERYSNRTEYGVTAQDTWKDVRRVIGTQAALRDYVAGKLKLELTDDAKKVAAMSGDKAALRKEFEAELKALGALKGADLDKAIGERRKKLGLKTDSTPMTPAEITAAGAAVLPDGERKADSSKSPLVPENMREKAALAWPEKTEMERELEIRKQLPEWKRVQPKSKMQATFDAMYTGDSDAVKTLLAFIDSTRLIDGKDGGTPEKQVVYDASLYGINTGATFTAMSADLVVNQESFQIQTRDGKKGGKSWYVYDLSEKGYKDAMDTAVALQKRINTAGITKEEKDKYQYFLDDLVKTVEDKSKSMEAFEMTDGKGGNRWVELNNKMKPTLAALNQNKGSTVQAPVIPTFDPQNPLAAITALTTAYAAVDLKAGHKDAKPGGPTMPAK
ncbi:MAG: hypothetical protein EBV03_05415, partial [Proteobacteria bacterium]|nr:hypothetical protein [Pseudomonadota bacterium]